jgi:hypothetical protein
LQLYISLPAFKKTEKEKKKNSLKVFEKPKKYSSCLIVFKIVRGDNWTLKDPPTEDA